MPTYEYECTKGHQFEVEQRISEDPLKTCRLCRSKVRRLISSTSFVLKGSGWYADGYSSGGGNGSSSRDRSSSNSKPSSSDSASSSSSGSSSTSSSDSS